MEIKYGCFAVMMGFSSQKRNSNTGEMGFEIISIITIFYQFLMNNHGHADPRCGMFDSQSLSK
jgi:hypothetical protein